ncbi:hypothetical protein F4775DRAFT_564330, partial [Biscogniauxia sp. FL1348]
MEFTLLGITYLTCLYQMLCLNSLYSMASVGSLRVTSYRDYSRLERHKSWGMRCEFRFIVSRHPACPEQKEIRRKKEGSPSDRLC